MPLIDSITHIEEGRRHTAYPDALTHSDPWTIGEGHTGPEVREGLTWTDAQIDAAKAADIAEATHECTKAFPWFTQLDPVRYAVLQSLMFQLGPIRLGRFVHFLGAMRDQRWNAAADELRNSTLYHQCSARTGRLARAVETGESQWSTL